VAFKPYCKTCGHWHTPKEGCLEAKIARLRALLAAVTPDKQRDVTTTGPWATDTPDKRREE